VKKIEFVKPILHIDKFFKVADYLIQSDVDELVQLGRTMRNAYENQMMESEEKEDLPSDLPQDRIKQWQNPAECKTGVCD
tara:strand:+ start:353 stop:592 length:240 start_codon:yes stop_codon:yes gene_type:complete